MWAPTKCVNHPERDYVALCDRCRVPLCSGCVRIYEYDKDPISKGRKNLCPECNDIRTRAESTMKLIVYIAIGVGFIVMLVFYVSNFVL